MRALSLALLFALPLTAHADDVTDTLDSARQAYDEGEIAYAMEELTFALQILKGMRAGNLSDLLPAAQDGWTRTVDPEEGQAMAMMGGTAAVANYANEAGDSFTVTVLVDNPMIAGLAGMFGNPVMMAQMGQMIRVGREKFVDQDGEISGIIGGRIMVQGSGDARDALIEHLKAMDFEALKGFTG